MSTLKVDEKPASLFYPSDEFKQDAHVSSMTEYEEMYKYSVEEPEKFWADISKEFFFHRQPTGKFLEHNFDVGCGPIQIKWMSGCLTNVCYNVVDRIISKCMGDRIAYICEGTERKVTYNQLKDLVCKLANVYKSLGVVKGDRIACYMPVILELVVAMLAAARIGAVHSVVFAGFSSEALAERIVDANCKLLVTCDGTYRGTKFIGLKALADGAIDICKQRNHQLVSCIVYHHLKCPIMSNGMTSQPDASTPVEDHPAISWNSSVDVWWHEIMAEADDQCDPVWMGGEDPLFILFTSGSTGKPKGVLHTTAGYMIYAATTFKYVFNHKLGDVFFCTADLGWVTGHTANVYGALANGATIVLFEGVIFHPNASRLWQIIDNHSVTTFYTAPTVIRSLMKLSDDYVLKHSLSSLKLLGTAGEPINPEAWAWYYHVVGKGRCPIVDTYWQTETAAPMLTSLPGCMPMKPGSASLPFFGVVPAIVDDMGNELKGNSEGHLVFKCPWPSIIRTVDGNHRRFEETYFHKFPRYFCCGDGARRDEDGYYWITGRTDDLLNVSGHLLSTAQVESALMDHRAVAETAVVSAPHTVKGECIYAYIVLKNGYEHSVELDTELKLRVRTQIGPLAAPDVIHLVSALPKTRSGKIMRRILKKIAADARDLGDLSTLANEEVIEQINGTRHMYSCTGF